MNTVPSPHTRSECPAIHRSYTGAATREGGSRIPTIYKVVMVLVVISPLRCLRPVSLPPEFLLDLAWFLLAINIVGVLLRRSCDDGSRRVSMMVSTICVLILLFPIISAGDDVAQQELANDACTSQLVIKSLDKAKLMPVFQTDVERPVLVVPPPAPLGLEAEVSSVDHGLVSPGRVSQRRGYPFSSLLLTAASFRDRNWSRANNHSGTNSSPHSRVELLCTDDN